MAHGSEHRKNRRSRESNKKVLDKLAQSRSNQKDQDLARMEQEKFLETQQVEEHETYQALVTEFRVSNIPYQCSATVVGEALENIVGKGMVKCNLEAPNHFGRLHKGSGRVILQTVDAAQKVLSAASKDSISLHGRRLRVQQSKHNPAQDTTHGNSVEVKCKSLEICELESPRHLLSTWTTNERVKFVLDCSNHSFSLGFIHSSRELQIRARLKAVQGRIQFAQEDQGECSLIIHLRHSASVYQLESETSRQTEGDSLETFFSQFFAYLNNASSLSFGEIDQWMRTGDFTPNQSISKGRVYRLRLEQTVESKELNKLIQRMQRMRLISKPLEISAFSCERMVIAPNYDPVADLAKKGVEWNVRFKLLCMKSGHGGIIGDHTFTRDVNALAHCLTSVSRQWSEKILDNILQERKPVQNLLDAFREVQNRLEVTLESPDPPTNELTLIRHLVITPTTMYAIGPEVEEDNRVLRQYMGKDNGVEFLRVSFAEDDSTKLIITQKADHVVARIKHFLREGVNIGGMHFEFLAFSSSQLKECACWFVSTTHLDSWSVHANLNTDTIRQWMGDFDQEKCIAKCAARMGQCFSTTRMGPAISAIPIDDVKRNGFCFSDGVGTISQAIADELAQHMHVHPSTSAYQIRYGGCKGVVSVDPSLSGRKLCVRPSQTKFHSSHQVLEVCQAARWKPCFLNRQIIILLSTNGIEDPIFERVQARMVAGIEQVLTSRQCAEKMLEMCKHSTDQRIVDICLGMLEAGWEAKREPFLRDILVTLRSFLLRELRERTRLLVKDGCFLMGVMDETKTLNYGEIFLQISEDGCAPRTITGHVMIAKNPCLHPGDVRVLKAVDSPNLRHLVNVVVFPQNGHRPHPNECSGSDLDGDEYTIIWDPSLIPVLNKDPMDYTAASPKLATGSSVQISEIIDFFVDYAVNDKLGMIANAHLAHADMNLSNGTRVGAHHPICIQLAALHSIAVDFPKTGIPANFPKEVRVDTYPDFMEKDKSSKTYESQSVLGKMYRTILDLGDRAKRQVKQAQACPVVYDEDVEVERFSEYVDDALAIKCEYEEELTSIMNRYGVHNEAQVITGQVLEFYARNLKGRKGRMHEVRMLLKKEVDQLTTKYRKIFEEDLEDEKDQMDQEDSNSAESSGDSDPTIRKARKAAAWYYVTYKNADRVQDPLLSFAWIAHDFLVSTKLARRVR